MDRRVVVTGIGVAAPGGIGVKPFWQLLTEGRTATRTISLFDATGYRSRIAAECDFEPDAHGLRPAQVAALDRHVLLGLVATRQAAADAGLADDGVSVWRLGVSMGTAVGSSTRQEHGYVAVSEAGRRWVVDPARNPPGMYRALTVSTLAAEVARDLDARGPVGTVSTGCTSGLDAIGYALQAIQDNQADVVMAGAADAPITPTAVACFDAIRATSARNDDPATASRPFDATRDGFVLGEGSAALVLEALGHARRRGARIYCEVAGFANRGNAYHMTGLSADGVELAAAATAALGQARMAAEDVHYVNAHGSGTRQNDRHETAAVKRSLGAHAHAVPVSSIKSMVGHSLGAIGSIELVACVLALTDGVIPPTANYAEPDPECDLDYVPRQAREARVTGLLSLGSGFGGFQSAVALRALAAGR